jgi:hypothetical protein
MVLDRIDTLIWLDLPRRVIWPRVFRRTFNRVWKQEELWHGNRETWRNSFFSRESIIWWAMKTFNLRRRQYAAAFADPALDHLTRVRFRSPRQLSAWLATLPQEANA